MIVRDRNVGGGSVRPSYMSAEEVYDRATWRCISSYKKTKKKCTNIVRRCIYGLILEMPVLRSD